MYGLRFPWGIHWGLLESSCHNFCTLLFAFCNKIQFLFDMVVYLLTYPVLTFNTNPLIARCLSALCRRSWGKDYSRAPPPSPTFWCGNYHNHCVRVKLPFRPFFGEGRGAVSFPKQWLVVMPTYMSWFHFILDSNFIFSCFKLIIIHYNTQTQKKIKFVPRIKLNQNIYMVFNWKTASSFIATRYLVTTDKTESTFAWASELWQI